MRSHPRFSSPFTPLASRSLSATLLALACSLLVAEEIVVTAPADGQIPVSPAVDKFALPQTRASIGRTQIEDTVNAVDAEDTLKYLPSVFLRKRNNGDTQAVLATRTWGPNSSARSLVYVDDVPISALIANDNNNGAPRWGMVAPESIQGVDMLYGPFAAEYPGNALGGVVLITTRQPEKLEATLKQTEAVQTYGFYKTKDTYLTHNTAATVGDRIGRFGWFLGVNHVDSHSQPLGFVTNGATANPPGTTGTIQALNKTGQQTNVVGASGLLHTVMNQVTAKVGCDLTDTLRASYSLGFWSNQGDSSVETYLTDAAGRPTYGNVSGFGTSTYQLEAQHLMHAATLKSDSKGIWDGELVVTRYDYLTEIQRSSAGIINNTTTVRTNGNIARRDGTNWTTVDAKGIWRPTGIEGTHEASFGAHGDRYVLNAPGYTTPDWEDAGFTGAGTPVTLSAGKTRTAALWTQDAWRLAPRWKLTLGVRFEDWKAYDGENRTATARLDQPEQTSRKTSPKASLAWQATDPWRASLSFGQAYRFPTVSELYQSSTVGTNLVNPNPDLKPEDVRSFELANQYVLEDVGTSLRLSLFLEDTRDTIISQANANPFGTGTLTYVTNVDHTRAYGVEFVARQQDALIRRLELSNSVTWADSEIVSNPDFVNATTTSTGKKVPYVPDWRNTFQATYRPSEPWAISSALRYQGKMFSTLDNSDSVSQVYGAFDGFTVVDAKIRYQAATWASLEGGVDNVFDEKYILFHPFPGRTYVVGGRLAY